MGKGRFFYYLTASQGAGPPAYAGGSVSLLRGGAVKGRKAADLHKTLDPRYGCERAFAQEGLHNGHSISPSAEDLGRSMLRPYQAAPYRCR